MASPVWRSSSSCSRCASDSSPTRSSRTSLTRSRSRSTLIGLLTFSAAFLFAQNALSPAPIDDPKVIRRFAVAGDPHGVAIGSDGTLYVGLAKPQSIIAVDPKSGAILRSVILDSEEIASTKELITLRTNRQRTRLYVANGSDESATILALPSLKVIREITLEGESIRDALPDPSDHFLFLLGRHVHVFDANGEKELRTLPLDDPTAIAASATTLAVAKGPVLMRFALPSFEERQSLSISDIGSIRMLALARRDVIVALTSSALVEVTQRPRVDSICLPKDSSAQIATLAGDTLLFAEQRCNSSSAFAATARNVTPASLYGVNAYALAFDAMSNTLAVTDRTGFLTIYKVPRAVSAK